MVVGRYTDIPYINLDKVLLLLDLQRPTGGLVVIICPNGSYGHGKILGALLVVVDDETVGSSDLSSFVFSIIVPYI